MWIFEQITGNLFSDSSVLIGKGYSGHPPFGVNNPAKQNVPDVGPIPQGYYSIGAPHDTEHGPYTLSLTPHDENQMFGRSGFLMHGDRVDAPGKFLASLGCIIMPRDVREEVWNSVDRTLKVVSGEIR